MTAITKVREDVQKIASVVEVAVLDTAEKEAQAAAILRVLKTHAKDIEAERKARVQPIKAQASAIDAEYRPVRKELERVERLIKGRLAEAVTRREAANLKAQEAALAAVNDGNTEAAKEALATVQHADTPDGISYRTVREVVVVAPGSVPREYCVPDMSLIQLAVSAGRDVPGVEIREKKVIAARGVR